MITPMKHRIVAALACFAALVASPVAALAQRQQEGPEIFDARLYGFQKNVVLDGHSTALIWIVFIILAFICLVVLFKDAKRTHLD